MPKEVKDSAIKSSNSKFIPWGSGARLELGANQSLLYGSRNIGSAQDVASDWPAGKYCGIDEGVHDLMELLKCNSNCSSSKLTSEPFNSPYLQDVSEINQHESVSSIDHFMLGLEAQHRTQSINISSPTNTVQDGMAWNDYSEEVIAARLHSSELFQQPNQDFIPVSFANLQSDQTFSNRAPSLPNQLLFSMEDSPVQCASKHLFQNHLGRTAGNNRTLKPFGSSPQSHIFSPIRPLSNRQEFSFHCSSTAPISNTSLTNSIQNRCCDDITRHGRTVVSNIEDGIGASTFVQVCSDIDSNFSPNGDTSFILNADNFAPNGDANFTPNESIIHQKANDCNSHNNARLNEAYEQRWNAMFDAADEICLSLILNSKVPYVEDSLTEPVDDETDQDARQKLAVKKTFVGAMEKLQEDQLPTKRRGNLPKECTSYLKKWFEEHSSHPCEFISVLFSPFISSSFLCAPYHSWISF